MAVLTAYPTFPTVIPATAYPTTGAPAMTPAPTDPTTPANLANKLENLPNMVQGVMGNDQAVQTDCTTQFRRLLSIEKNPPIQQVINSGVVPRFVGFLSREDVPGLQFESAWALTNIASGTSDHTRLSLRWVPFRCLSGYCPVRMMM